MRIVSYYEISPKNISILQNKAEKQLCRKKTSTTFFFITGPCRHNATLQNADVIVSKFSNRLYSGWGRSADGTYAVNIALTFICHHGYHEDGPHTVICTNAGTWNQFQPKSGERRYSAGTPTHCIPGLLFTLLS